MNKTCSTCKIDKPLDEFTKNKTKILGVESRCKPCKAAAQVANRYGLTPTLYGEMFVRQGHVCAICKEPESVPYRDKIRSLAVDHDHRTGEIRSLLCTRCNRLIGVARERVDILRAAIDYLEQDAWTGHYVPTHA